jgi:hypothetical protein
MSKRVVICLAVVLLALIVLAGWAICAVWGLGCSGGPRVVARAVTPDGTELCVVQEANPVFTEPFTTSVVYRKPGGTWGWFYYDHQDIFWRHGQTEIDPNAKRITILRGGRRTITFDWESETYTKWAGQRADRIFKGAQRWFPAGWTVTNSVRGLL